MFRSLCIYWSALIFLKNTLFWFLLYRICKTERNFNIDAYQLSKTFAVIRMTLLTFCYVSGVSVAFVTALTDVSSPNFQEQKLSLYERT